MAGFAVLLALRGLAQGPVVPAEGVSRPVELQRAIMGSLGRHLEALRVEAEGTLCAGGPADAPGVLDRFIAGLGVPVEGAVMYSTSGEEQARRGGSAPPPWAGETFFREEGSPWLKGRSIAVALARAGDPGPGMTDLRIPMQCDGSGSFQTKAWAVVRLDLRRLLDRLGPELNLGAGESVWMAATPEQPLFLRGPAGGMESRLSGLARQRGPKGAALWERMRSMPEGRLMCDGFDPEAFDFRRFMGEWVTLKLGEVPVLLVRETPAERYTPPADGRTGVWVDSTGTRLALLLDGSNCQLYLRRNAGGAAKHAAGRLLASSLSARDHEGVTTYQGEFSPGGPLALSVYTDHAERGVTREVFRLVRKKPATGSERTLPALRL